MAKKLIIVESPAKCHTVGQFAGKDYTVLASYGHVRAFPRDGKAIDTEHDFEAKYILIDRNKPQVERILRAVKDAEEIVLASDLDREGSAIAWHLREIIRSKGLDKGRRIIRATFPEITKRAVLDGLAHAGDIDMNQVRAQQTRSILDYLVGFNLSPVLWHKVRSGLSAGRVQSPALRLIVEREAEIQAFDTKEYWSIESKLFREVDFPGKLTEYAGKKVEQFTFPDRETAEGACKRLQEACGSTLTVEAVTHSERTRKPYAPFTTATLQMDAARRLGFTTDRTMKVAQTLYEGMEFNGEHVGLISYMRTDAVNLSEEALSDIRGFLSKTFSSDYLPKEAIRYHTKSKNAQEAHEAIRPTSVARTPEKMAKYLDGEHLKLYALIWKRAVASQMSNARLATVSVSFPVNGLKEGKASFRANGSTLVFPGFLALYEEATDAKEEATVKLPKLKEGDEVSLKAIIPTQHFTEPPPRYGEASLVKAMEELDIGRPSTYATIIKVLQTRGYVTLEAKRFIPTDIGKTVAGFLTKHFAKYVDYTFTSQMENDLDAISRGEKDWKGQLRAFWGPFKAQVKDKDTTVTREEANNDRILGNDPQSGRVVKARLGKFGPTVQLGDRKDGEKLLFASILPPMSWEKIGLDEALALLNERQAYPKVLGQAKGEDVSVGRGKYGKYAKQGSFYATIPDERDLATVTLEDALAFLAERRAFLADKYPRDFGGGVKVVKGRFGYFLSNGQVNANLEEGFDWQSMTKEEAIAFLTEHGHKPKHFGGKGGHGKPLAKKGGFPSKGKPHGKGKPKSQAKDGVTDDLPM